jgi:hypothetical protein
MSEPKLFVLPDQPSCMDAQQLAANTNIRIIDVRRMRPWPDWLTGVPTLWLSPEHVVSGRDQVVEFLQAQQQPQQPPQPQQPQQQPQQPPRQVMGDGQQPMQYQMQQPQQQPQQQQTPDTLADVTYQTAQSNQSGFSINGGFEAQLPSHDPRFDDDQKITPEVMEAYMRYRNESLPAVPE